MAVLLAASVALHAGAAGAAPQELTLINPYPAVGPAEIAGNTAANKVLRLMHDYSVPALTDILVRQLRGILSSALGVPVTVERKSRMRMREGHEYVARAVPDGRTLLLSGSVAMVIYPLVRDLPFDPSQDFTPVALVARMPVALIASSRFQAESVRQLIDLAHAAPGRFNLGSSRDFSVSHLTGELFKNRAGVDITHVSFNGGADAVRSVMANQIEAAFVPLPSVLPYRNSQRLRILGLAERERYPTLPEMPTLGEAGLAGFEVSGWYGLFAPPGTPDFIVARISAEIAEGLQSTQTARLLLSLGLWADYLPAREFLKLLRAENDRWAPLIDALDASP